MTDTLVALLLSAGVGFGMFVIIRGLRPRPEPLAVTAARLQRAPTGATRSPGRGYLGVDLDGAASGSGLAGWQQAAGEAGMRLLDITGLADTGRLRTQLRILDKPLERHAYEKVLGAVAGFALPLLVVAVLAVGGVAVSPLWPLGAGLLLAVGGFFYPDLPLSEQVTRRQQAFRHALSSYLDLVTIILAGGGGIESALAGAAEAGDGWAFAELRTALRRAELTGRTPWELFDELGETLGVDELRELAASVSLAGGHGAKVRQSLAAKADALRAHQAAEVETMADTRTEKMIVPVTVMIVGLTLFIGYGAIEAISTDGGVTDPVVVVPEAER